MFTSHPGLIDFRPGDLRPGDAADAVSLRCGQAAVELSAPPSVRQTLRDYLSPYIAFAPIAGVRAPLRIHCSVDRERLRAILRWFRSSPSSEIRLHGGLCGRTARDGSTLRVWNIGDNIAYEITVAATTDLHFVCDAFSATACLDLARIVRGVLSRAVEQRGGRRIHAAAVGTERGAVLLVGPSGAGKTSFMLAALQSRWASSLIANDKALLVRGTPAPSVLGIPYAISIGPGALASCPALARRRNGRFINGETYYWPRQVAAALGSNLVDGKQVLAVVRCVLRLDDAAPRLRRVGIEEAIEGIACFTEAMHPDWLHSPLGLECSATCTADDLAMVPCFELACNPWLPSYFDVCAETFA